ncbi:MAG: VWA domain-containing protein [Gemmatimonadota bacterium]|nr:VWA domain-containing protein [Gemmatimonadota bacterium]
MTSSLQPASLLTAVAVVGLIIAFERVRARRVAALAVRLDAPYGRAGGALIVSASLCVGGALQIPDGVPLEPAARSGASDAVLVVDVSASMAVGDEVPDRATRARLAAYRIIGEAGDARLGLIAFADRAHLLLPPTTDRALLTTYLEALGADVLSTGGSDLASALEGAVDVLEAEASTGGEVVGTAGKRSVVILSDGEGFETVEALTAAADRARDAGIVVHAVGVGTEEGGAVPGVPGSWSRARPGSLEAVTSRTGGIFLWSGSGGGAVPVARSLSGGPGDSGGKPAGRAGAVLAALALILVLTDSVQDVARRRWNRWRR